MELNCLGIIYPQISAPLGNMQTMVLQICRSHNGLKWNGITRRQINLWSVKSHTGRLMD